EDFIVPEGPEEAQPLKEEEELSVKAIDLCVLRRSNRVPGCVWKVCESGFVLSELNCAALSHQAAVAVYLDCQFMGIAVVHLDYEFLIKKIIQTEETRLHLQIQLNFCCGFVEMVKTNNFDDDGNLDVRNVLPTTSKRVFLLKFRSTKIPDFEKINSQENQEVFIEIFRRFLEKPAKIPQRKESADPRVGMEAPGNNQMPIQCRSGCGFFGTTATDGYCSKCYKDYLKRHQAPPSANPSTASSSSVSSGFSTESRMESPVIPQGSPTSMQKEDDTKGHSEEVASAAAVACADIIDEDIANRAAEATSS
ncbi:unnamed protein product, partial [Notodromas monacha]